MKCLILLLLLIHGTTFADGYCFVCQAKPKVKIDNKVQVTTQQMNLIPLETPQIDYEQELALQRQWDLVTSEIPVPGRLDQTDIFRRHKFRQNIANYNASPINQRQVQSRTVTKTYTGYLKQSFSVNSEGVINFNLSAQKQQKQQEQLDRQSGYDY